jgi:excisionase family DNA binding protein
MSGDDLLIPSHPDPVVMCERVNLEMARRFPMVWTLFVNGRIPPTAIPEPSASKAADRQLTVDEAAARLGVKKAWLYGEARAGRIPTVRYGRLLRFSESALANWLKRKGGR